MKPFRLTYLLFAALFLSFLYFVFFSFHSLIEYERLQNRIQSLSGELGSLKKKNQDLEQKLRLKSDPEAVPDSLVRYGYKKSNEILVNIIPPPLPLDFEEDKSQGFRFSPLFVWLGLLSILPLVFFVRRFLKKLRERPKREGAEIAR